MRPFKNVPLDSTTADADSCRRPPARSSRRRRRIQPDNIALTIVDFPSASKHPASRGVGRRSRLRSRSAFRRPFRAIEQAELKCRAISDTSHQTIERIDFPDKMIFAETANRRIGRYFADCRILCVTSAVPAPQRAAAAAAFAARMTSADDDHVKVQRLKQRHRRPYPPIQNRENSASSTS